MERVPFISKELEGYGSLPSFTEEEACDEKEAVPSLYETLGNVLHIALPNITGYVLTLINEVTNTIFIGHYGNSDEQAAVGLGNMMQNCFAVTFAFGLLAALDTLISQAYGAGNHDLCCTYLQRGRVIVALQLVWMVPILFFSHTWLLWLRQDSAVASYAQSYNRATCVGLIFYFQFEASRRFLQNRGNAVPPAVIAGIAAILHIGWAWFFIAHLGIGNTGAGFANSITWFSQCLFLSVYLLHHAPKEGLRPQSILWVEAEAWNGWMEWLRVGVPAMLQLCADAWIWEIMALLAGLIGNVALASEVDSMNFVWVWFMPVIGINSSAAALVGKAIGANQPQTAKRTLWTCVALDLAIWVPAGVIVLLTKSYIAEAFTDDDHIQRLIAECLSIYVFAGALDSAQNVMAGALRGLGRQNFAAVVILGCFWGILLPLGVILAFVVEHPHDPQERLLGLWQSFGVGTGVTFFIFLYYILFQLDFALIAKEAHDKNALEETGAS